MEENAWKLPAAFANLPCSVVWQNLSTLVTVKASFMHWHVIHATKFLFNSSAQFRPGPKNALPAQPQTEGEPGPGTLPDHQLPHNYPSALEGSVVVVASPVLVCLGAIKTLWLILVTGWDRGKKSSWIIHNMLSYY